MSLDNQSINGESKGSVETIDDDGADGVSMSAGTSDGERREFHKQKSILKQGHLRVKEDGQKVYKKTPSQAIMDATQLGIGYSVGRLSAKPERDVLMGDFYFVEKVWFPSSGSKETPSHKFYDFRFKTYAPVAFRYFRDLFGIQPSDFMLSLANEPIREISNPGASGSLFFVSNDDMFIVKTVTNKEASFLQKLLPGYYMNIHQNVRTLLPKFFGLYCYQSGNSNIRLTVMNNLLPSKYKCHMKFDLKGSTYKRKANKAERGKKSPTYKDLDFISMFPDGLPLDAETYDAVIKTISKDVRVLESFKIMDYSFLLGVHNIDQAEQERAADLASPSSYSLANPEREAKRNEFSAALEAIQLNKEGAADVRPAGGIPAKNDDGERLILFLGIIDILQNYRFAKKMEHGWKSMITDGDSVSVHKPSFYAKRFLDFIKDRVFKRVGVQRASTKRRSYRASNTQQPDRISERDQEMGDVPKEPGPGTYTPPSGDKPKGKVVTIRDPEVSPEHDLSITEDTSENPPSQQVNEPTESTSDLLTAVSEPSASEPSASEPSMSEPSMSDIPAASEMPSGADIPSASNIPSTSEPSETSSRAETLSESGPSQVHTVEASSSVAVSDHQVNHSESATQGKTVSFGEIKINIQQNESKTFKLNSVETTNVPSEASASPTVSHGDSSSHDDTSVVTKRPPENVPSVEDSQL